MGRQIKKTIIKYQKAQSIPKQQNKIQQNNNLQNNRKFNQDRERSRQKITNQTNIQNNHQQSIKKLQNNSKQITIDVNSRKARLQAMRKARQDKQKLQQFNNIDQAINNLNNFLVPDVKIVIVNDQSSKIIPQSNQRLSLNSNQQSLSKQVKIQQIEKQQKKQSIPQTNSKAQLIKQNNKKDEQNKMKQQSSSQSEQQKQQVRVLHKPVFLSKQDRSQFHQNQFQQKRRQQQRKKKNLKYTTKLLLEQSIRKDQQQNSQQQIDNLNDDQNQTNLPNDDDNVNEQLEYQLWKIRELKRIRRDREVRQKFIIQKNQIQRRRKMNNQQILLENRLLGSDLTDQQTQTKYVFMQKYYHKGAFYQDSSDPIFQRDYNLPTPMEMQDKSALPSVLQKRKGNFGKKGQSKYTHLTAQDTTDTNPLTRPDQSILNNWKKKLAGYKK